MEEEPENLRGEQPSLLGPNTKQELLALAEDLPQLWDDPKTSP
jgi:hypothetical protein